MYKQIFRMGLTGLLLILIVSCGDKNPLAPDPFKSNPPANLDPFESNARLGRGVNLGNALEAPYEGAWGVTLESEYFELIMQAGFDAVRIPIRWSAWALNSEPYQIADTFFDRVDWAIEQALIRNLTVVINMHHYEEIMQDPAAHKERFLSMWQQIADHYKNYSADLIFEILNEPNSNLDAALWNVYLAEALTVIRETNPGRTIIVGSADWYGIGSVPLLEIPQDEDNVIVSFHYYSPFQFTHQGAEWVSGSEEWLGTEWRAGYEEIEAVESDFLRVMAWATANNRPLYLGEFGAYSAADMIFRALWTDFVAREAESREISWAYWEFGAGFGVYNLSLSAWNDQLLNALIPPLSAKIVLSSASAQKDI